MKLSLQLLATYKAIWLNFSLFAAAEFGGTVHVNKALAVF